MTGTIQQEIRKKNIKKTIFFILKIILFILLVIFTVYFFIHSPAWVNKINHLLNQEEAAANLEPGMGEMTTVEETIIIPQANIYVPLVSMTEYSQDKIKNAATKGLVLTKRENGLLIVGSYSDYFWKKGEYKYILSSLGNLKPGDLLGINNNNIFTKYEVLDLAVVKANDFSELEIMDADLIIASHWPPSFTNYKLVLRAKKIE